MWLGKLIPSKVRKLVPMSINVCQRTKSQSTLFSWVDTASCVWREEFSLQCWVPPSFSGIWVGPKRYPKEERAQTSEYVQHTCFYYIIILYCSLRGL